MSNELNTQAAAFTERAHANQLLTAELKPHYDFIVFGSGKFDNADDALWPGQFVNLRIQLAIRRNVIAVPVTAVQQGRDGPYAFVVGDDRTVQKRPLKVGALNKTTAIIGGGLQPGERIVIDGQYRIQAGSKVEAAAQAASPADTGPANSP